MEKVIEVRYAAGSIKTYQKEILSQELTGLFLPVSWIEHAGGSTGMYDAEGYMPVKDLFRAGSVRKTGSDIAYAVTGYALSLIGAAMEAENRYIFPEDYEVSPELIFASILPENPQRARLIWKSAERSANLKDPAKRFCEGIRPVLGLPAARNADDPDGYIARATAILSEDHPGLAALYSRLDGFRKNLPVFKNH